MKKKYAEGGKKPLTKKQKLDKEVADRNAKTLQGLKNSVKGTTVAVQKSGNKAKVAVKKSTPSSKGVKAVATLMQPGKAVAKNMATLNKATGSALKTTAKLVSAVTPSPVKMAKKQAENVARNVRVAKAKLENNKAQGRAGSTATKSGATSAGKAKGTQVKSQAPVKKQSPVAKKKAEEVREVPVTMAPRKATEVTTPEIKREIKTAAVEAPKVAEKKETLKDKVSNAKEKVKEAVKKRREARIAKLQDKVKMKKGGKKC